MLWWSVLAARAGVVEDLGAASARYPKDAVVACSPMSDLVALLPELPVPPGLSSSPTGRLLLELTDPELSTALGIDPTGGVTMVTREDQELPVELALPFSGTEEQADALVRRFDPSAEGSDGVWSLAMRGHRFLVVHEPGRRWSLVSGSTRPPAQAAPLPEVLGGLPDVSGCAMYLPGLPPTGRLHFEIEEVVGFLPLRGGAPGALRFVVDRPLGPLWTATDAPLPVGRADTAPDAVAVISVPIQDLFTSLATSQGTPELADELRRHVSLPSGATLAAWGDPRHGGRWMAMTEVLDRRGRPFSPRRLSRLAVRALRDDAGVSRVGRDGLAMAFGDQTVYARFAEDGRVALGSEPIAPSIALASVGTPWLDGTDMERVRGALFTLSATGAASVELALRASGERTVELVVEISLDPSARDDLRQGLQPVLETVLGVMGEAPGMRR
ncbi:MAG: hypothetical protein H6735_26460 [Alphaproteobacteria bacterium]|nr:hypothetical protein [Alphaproteobacteria bacterium]